MCGFLSRDIKQFKIAMNVGHLLLTKCLYGKYVSSVLGMNTGPNIKAILPCLRVLQPEKVRYMSTELQVTNGPYKT